MLCCHGSCNTSLGGTIMHYLGWHHAMAGGGWVRAGRCKEEPLRSHVCQTRTSLERKRRGHAPPALWISAWETLSSSPAALWFLSLVGSNQSPCGHHCQCPWQPVPPLQPWAGPAPWAYLLPKPHWRCAVTAARGQDHVQVPGSSRRCQKYSNANQKSCQSGQSIDKVVTTKCFHYWKVSGFWLRFFFF